MTQQPKDQSLLLQEVTRQLLVLEEALANISQTRKQLKQRSVEMKSDIQNTVTRQLEALRQHETSLLKQVDLIQQAKDAALQGQEDKLHEALGSLTIALQVEENKGASPVRDILQRLKMLKIHPLETPTVCLKSDLSHLSDVASSYGNFGGMFDSEMTSASLPKPFEDYGDDEHHVLYRSIAESTGTHDKSITVTIPRLSQRPEDWLFMPPEDLTPAKTAASNFLFPPFMSGNLKERLDRHDGMSRVSIHQWLCDIQGQADVEEEEEADFDVLSSSAFLMPDSTKGSSIEVLSTEEVTPTFRLGSLDTSTTSVDTTSLNLPTSIQKVDHCPTTTYFNQVMSGPLTGWLSSVDRQEAQQINTTYCQEVLCYFHEVSNDTKMWLQKYSEKKQEEAAEDRNPLSIRNCKAKDSPSSDSDKWLYKKQIMVNNGKKEDPPLKSDCKAEVVEGENIQRKGKKAAVAEIKEENVACKASEGCVQSTPHHKHASQKNSCLTASSSQAVEESCSKWLDESYFDTILKQDTVNWLMDDASNLSASEVASQTDSKPAVRVAFPPFTCSTLSNSCWLLESTKSRVPSYHSDATSDVGSVTTDQWLIPVPESDEISPLGDLWSRVIHHQASSVSNSKSSNTSSTENSLVTAGSTEVPGCDWLLPSESGISTIPPDNSKWLLGKKRMKLEGKPKHAWPFISDNSPTVARDQNQENCDMPSKLQEFSQCFDSLFECFRQKEEDKRNWLLTIGPVME